MVIFHRGMLLFWKVSARLLHFFFLVVLAMQVGLTKEFGRDSTICREKGVHLKGTSPHPYLSTGWDMGYVNYREEYFFQ